MMEKIKLYVALMVNNIGDVIFDIFIAWSIGKASGDYYNAVYTIGTSMAFRAIISYLLGVVIDRHSKKNMIVASHLLSILELIVFFSLWNNKKVRTIVGILYILLNDINNEIFSKSYIVYTSKKFQTKEYIAFQSRSTAFIRLTTIAGSAVAGVLIESMSDNTIIILDICTYVISLIILLNIDNDEKE